MHSIELKFATCIIGHRRTNPIDFGEYRIHNSLLLLLLLLFREVEKIALICIRAMESNYYQCAMVLTVHLVELKFGRRIMSYILYQFCFRINIGVQKIIRIHYKL